MTIFTPIEHCMPYAVSMFDWPKAISFDCYATTELRICNPFRDVKTSVTWNIVTPTPFLKGCVSECGGTDARVINVMWPGWLLLSLGQRSSCRAVFGWEIGLGLWLKWDPFYWLLLTFSSQLLALYLVYPRKSVMLVLYDSYGGVMEIIMCRM